MRCSRVRMRLAGERAAIEARERQAIEAHLAACSACRGQALALETLDERLRAAWPQRPRPSFLKARVLQAAREARAAEPAGPPRWRRLAPWLVPAAVALSVATGLLVFNRSSDPPRLVRLELPAGTVLAREPSIEVRRAGR